jgi:hypothetical protein
VITAARYDTEPYGLITLEIDRQSRTVILAPPVRMDFRGLTADMLKPGVSVTIEGFASMRSPNELRAEVITIDGQPFDLR